MDASVHRDRLQLSTAPKGDVGETSERRVGAHMDFFERIDLLGASVHRDRLQVNTAPKGDVGEASERLKRICVFPSA